MEGLLSTGPTPSSSSRQGGWGSGRLGQRNLRFWMVCLPLPACVLLSLVELLVSAPASGILHLCFFAGPLALNSPDSLVLCKRSVLTSCLGCWHPEAPGFCSFSDPAMSFPCCVADCDSVAEAS